LFWVAEKDRYLRQLMIRDIEQLTGRALIVYFTDCESPDGSAQIHPADDAYLLELVNQSEGQGVDLFLETNGGYTDAAEKLVTIVRQQVPDLRVIVPRRAKSNGTLLALAAREIVMGPASELGPIDPLVTVGPQNAIPAQFILQTPNVDPIVKQAAAYAVAQTKKLAKTLLQTGMMSKATSQEIDEVVEKLATRDHFHSHGSVIDSDEAAAMGLVVQKLPSSDELWQRVWLLRCMYAADIRSAKLIKVFEGRQVSNSIRASA
jgi:ClpP class serine protease